MGLNLRIWLGVVSFLLRCAVFGTHKMNRLQFRFVLAPRAPTGLRPKSISACGLLTLAPKASFAGCAEYLRRPKSPCFAGVAHLMPKSRTSCGWHSKPCLRANGVHSAAALAPPGRGVRAALCAVRRRHQSCGTSRAPVSSVYKNIVGGCFWGLWLMWLRGRLGRVRWIVFGCLYDDLFGCLGTSMSVDSDCFVRRRARLLFAACRLFLSLVACFSRLFLVDCV